MNPFTAYPNVLLALCVWREGRGEGSAARLGILWVMLNRSHTRRLSIEEVILQPKQFSSFNAGDPNVSKFPSPANPAEWVAFQQICELIGSPGVSDPTSGATHYHSIPPTQPFPKWADPKALTVTIGAFRFYKLNA